MWQENHISFHDEVMNMIGCLVMLVSFVASLWIATRFISTQSRRNSYKRPVK